MGTVLATILLTLGAQFALGVVLLAALRLRKPKEAEEPQEQLNFDFVTRDELNERLSQEAKKWEWLLAEWHEKFSTLHARLAKRVKVSQREIEPEPAPVEDTPRVSAVHLRRFGSP